ncbi:DUF1015 family protein [Nocardioides ungokensis]|uniref:DUF1015 family protein n=1 Tax=Nocardioides ungokensis TaxID=1643322 RepID=UPI0015DD8B3F|nr:DUF1015 family protein [Nocardioides ungokensis]
MDDSRVVTPPYLAGPLRLLPFRGLMLAPGRIGDPASARAFARPYRDVARRLHTWEEQGQVRHDTEPAVYLHEYTSGGITVRGLVGALDISRRADSRADRVVYPHEGIHPLQVAELADRMLEMQMNPAPILLVHRGHSEVRRIVQDVLTLPPDEHFTDRGAQTHRIWAIRDPERIAALDRALATSRAMIADGHHRYAAYVRLQQQDTSGAHDLGLAMLVDQDDSPLFLGAIHRVLEGTTLADLEQAAASNGVGFERRAEADAVAALAPEVLVATDGKDWATLNLTVPRNSAAVEVLHQSVLPGLGRQPERIGYHHSVEEALTRLAVTGGIAVLPRARLRPGPADRRR